MKKIKFSKMVATGNDFVIMDNRSSVLGSRLPVIAKKVCDRKLGIGADGFLLLEKSKRCDFKMRIFNPDGSEPKMCGNGSRCIALYAKLNKIAGSFMSIETKAGILKAKVKGNIVKINMTDAKGVKLGIGLKVNKKAYNLYHINTGVPHTVYFTDKIKATDLQALGSSVRYHRRFKPAGTNFNLVKTKGKKAISIRTYERGVEHETLACGTGAVAAAIITSIVRGHSSPVKVYAKGGKLNIYFKKKDKNKFTDIFLEGEALEVFNGEFNIM